MTFDKKPLGYINLLNNAQKSVFPTDDFFVNYVFSKKENWNNLRSMLNIFFEAYSEKYNRQDGFHFVDEEIRVETQYKHYVNKETIQKAQDVYINEFMKNALTFVEFHNRANSKPPITIKARNYSVLSISKAGADSEVSQVWILAENNDDVLRRQAISNFRRREENTDEYYPDKENIMFISLPRLMEEDNKCGHLARLLMGVESENSDPELQSIADMFKCEYETFKNNEEVVKAMTYADERFEDGREEARAEIIANLERKIVEKRKMGENATMIRNYVEEFAAIIGISSKTVDELIRKNIVEI